MPGTTSNKLCWPQQTTEPAQISVGPTPAPHTPAGRILQYDGKAPTRPASRSRREDSGSSYCEVRTIDEDDSSYGSRTRGPIHSRLGPQGENRRQSTAHRGSGIQSRLGPKSYHEGYGCTDPDDHTYWGESHATSSRPRGHNYVPLTQPRNTYLRAAKRTQSQPYRSKSAAKNSKFVPEIAHADVTTTKFPLNVRKYNGSSDPDDHMNIFIGSGCNGRWDEPTWCHFFPQTLTGLARAWFDSLPVGSLASFEDLHAKFLAHFCQQRHHERDSMDVMNILRGDNKSLESFVVRYNKECLEIGGVADQMARNHFIVAVKDEQMVMTISSKEGLPKKWEDVMLRSRRTPRLNGPSNRILQRHSLKRKASPPAKSLSAITRATGTHGIAAAIPSHTSCVTTSPTQGEQSTPSVKTGRRRKSLGTATGPRLPSRQATSSLRTRNFCDRPSR
ncbi:putative retrotransposon gag domain-containing protein [Helianthus annuus]|nr:putative retrotransposon gag domain-containing protein [Helianthus annuus]